MKFLGSLGMVTLLCFFSVTANASTNISLKCENQSLQACTKKMNDALTKIGCDLDHNETKCDYFLAQDPQNPTGPGIATKNIECKAYAAKCEEPNMGLLSDSCASDSKLVKLSKSEQLHNGYWYGFFGSYSRGICVRK